MRFEGSPGDLFILCTPCGEFEVLLYSGMGSL